jgi:hypothetical protein
MIGFVGCSSRSLVERSSPKWSRGKEPRSGGDTEKPKLLEGGRPKDISSSQQLLSFFKKWPTGTGNAMSRVQLADEVRDMLTSRAEHYGPVEEQ